MNSLQNRTDIQGDTPEDYVISFQENLTKLSTVPEVEAMMLKLQYLGLQYDPFQDETTSECQQIIDHLGLTHHLRNPYLATNLLLRLLDKTEEQLKRLQQ